MWFSTDLRYEDFVPLICVFENGLKIWTKYSAVGWRPDSVLENEKPSRRKLDLEITHLWDQNHQKNFCEILFTYFFFFLLDEK